MTPLAPSDTQNGDIPLSRAMRHDGLLYISGQVAFKPGTMEPIANNVMEQAQEIFRLIDGILEETQVSKESIVMTRIYLTQIKRDFHAMNTAYAQWLGDHRPARTTVGVELAVDGLLIEVDCVAALS